MRFQREKLEDHEIFERALGALPGVSSISPVATSTTNLASWAGSRGRFFISDPISHNPWRLAMNGPATCIRGNRNSHEQYRCRSCRTRDTWSHTEGIQTFHRRPIHCRYQPCRRFLLIQGPERSRIHSQHSRVVEKPTPLTCRFRPPPSSDAPKVGTM